MIPAVNPAKHVAALDGIRGIAILAVLITHAVTLSGKSILTSQIWYAGWWGVDLFFVLSGFLITGILLRTKESPNRLISFYARRLLRIFPIYYLLLVTLLILAAFVPYVASQISASWKDRLPYFLYLQNLAVLWGRRAKDAPLGHFWSLAVEEQFYLVWPMLVWSLSRGALLRLSMGLTIAALFLRVVLVKHFGPHFWIFTLTSCRGDGLLLGSIVAILTMNGERIAKPLITSMGSLGLAIITFILVFDNREFTDTDAGPLVYTIGVTGFALTFAAVIAVSQYRIPLLSSIFESKFLRSFGKYSYGIYVYHIPLFILIYDIFGQANIRLPMQLLPGAATIVAMCGLSYLVAWVSFHLFESKILKWKRYFEATEPVRTAS